MCWNAAAMIFFFFPSFFLGVLAPRQANKSRWHWREWGWFPLCFASSSFAVIPPPPPILLSPRAPCLLWSSHSLRLLLQPAEEDRERDVEGERDLSDRHRHSLNGEVARLQVGEHTVYPSQRQPLRLCQLVWYVQIFTSTWCVSFRDCMKLGEVDGKKIGCTVSLLVSLRFKLDERCV